MKQSVNFSDFCDAFRQAGRNDNFSYQGKRVLFDYLEQYEDDTGTEIELDIVALCCEYSEMGWEEVVNTYDIDLSGCDDDEERGDVVREYLQENTYLCGESVNGFVFADF